MSVLAVIPLNFKDRVLSYLPVSHILERIALYCYLLAGAEVHFCASSRQAMSLLKKVNPHYITAVPRILDRALTAFEKAGDTRHYFLRSILLWAIDTEAKQHFLRIIIRKYILKRLKRSFGNNLKGILVGGAALNPATQRLFQSAGIRVREGYGLSECCGVACLNRFEPGGNHPGTVGEPIPGVEVRILVSPGTGTGEVLIRSNGCMRGYFGRPEETAAMFTEDGWLKTGDRGELVDGRFLRITGRIKEQFKNAYGEYVAPVRLEQLLEQDQWVSRALITGGGRQYTGALIVPDFDLLQAWAEKQKVHWTAPLYMVHNTQILQEMEDRIAKINKTLSPHEQIRRFRLIHEPWTVENGMLTASLKLRREVIEEKYQKTLHEMYA
jgi:long-chain acyl-CoA synthetase